MDLSNLKVLLICYQQLIWQNVVMMLIGGVLIYLAIAKDYEPVLLLPIGFGAILTNLPFTGITEAEGFLGILYRSWYRNRTVPVICFHRYRCNDRLRSATGKSEDGSSWRSRTIGYFWHPDACARDRFPDQ